MENTTQATISISKGTRMNIKFYKEIIKQQKDHITMLTDAAEAVRQVWKSDQRLLDDIAKLKEENTKLKERLKQTVDWRERARMEEEEEKEEEED